ncbi:MAG: metallophosphoesterase family protein [Planctomycetales bacterium]|nr:metallophosphoesterase family protein [Planctomycetales bacterium]
MLEFLVLLAALGGHVSIWVFLFNRVNGSGAPRRLVKLASLLGYGVVVATPPFAALALLGVWGDAGVAWAWAYAILCAGFGLGLLPKELIRRATARNTARCRVATGKIVDLAAGLPHRPTLGWTPRLLGEAPANDLCRVEFNEKELFPDRLPARLDGLRILHLSDLHISGRLSRDYYERLLDQLEGREVDLAFVTGDILEKKECLSWAGETLRRVTARYGVHYILGNHDQRLKDVESLHRLLADLDWRRLGGRSCTVLVEGEEVLLCGDERPWFGPGPVPPEEQADATPRFRILLAHTPDRLAWARRHRFDLVFAGHTHGGQIRFPWIGPVICPSIHGIEYADGVFYESPTLMHVVRGAASYFPIRFRCAHEATIVTLRSSARAGSSSRLAAADVEGSHAAPCGVTPG